MNNDLISREALKEEIRNNKKVAGRFIEGVIMLIDNAPTVCGNNPKWCENCISKGKCASTRPQSEYEFIEILAQYVPDDICTYPEYKGKPYYSIHYKQNGEEFVGFGTYKIEVLSRYLKEYFMKEGAE